jgi:hypothetical protein
MIDDHQSIDLDYLTYSPYTVRCKEIEAQKGFFTHITDEDNNTIADGIIADIKPEQKTQTITIRPLNALFDAAVFYTPVSDAISWLASNIQQAFMTNSDTYQNRPINLTYTVASEQLPLTGFNLHETINILSVMISALKTYGVVVESTLDLVNKRIRVNIFRQEATKTILADLENLISSQVTIGDPFGSTNKATLRKIQVNDDESTTVLGDFNFYLHPDGSIDQSNTNRIQPVFWEMETLQLEDDMTDAQWLAAATARAKEILEPAKFDNEIILRYQQADKLVYPLELPIGAQCEIHLKGEIYASLLTGKALEGKTVTLYFGVVRTDLTKQLSIKNRETFSFESTVNAVMKSVAEKYPTKDSVADVYATKNQLTINNINPRDKIRIPRNADLNSYTAIGTYYSIDNVETQTLSNRPTNMAGTLTVSAPIQNINVGTPINGNWQYRVQTWDTYQGAKFVRWAYSQDGTTNVWSPWKSLYINEFEKLLEINSVGTTAASHACNWSEYYWIYVLVGTYNNIGGSMLVPNAYFSGSAAGSRPFLQDISDSGNNIIYQFWKNGYSAMYVKCNQTMGTTRVFRVYGINRVIS